jgi:C1A family cysteine protease
MFKIILFFSILFYYSIECVEIHSQDLKYLSNLFDSFQNNFQKEYKSSDEKDFRFSVFKNKTKSITAHNIAYQKKHTKYYQKLNQFSDMTHDEYKQWLKRSANKMAAPKSQIIKIIKNSSVSHGHIPLRVDLRRGLPGIKDQEQCGSCWAFGANVAIEQAYYLKHMKIISLSEQQLVDCVYNETYNSCELGGFEYDGKEIIINV